MNQNIRSKHVSRAAVGLGVSTLVLLLGCAQQRDLPELQPGQPLLQPPKAEPVGITQVGFGDAAVFAACSAENCPRPTPKTLIDADAEPAAAAEPGMSDLAAGNPFADEIAPTGETAVGSWSESRMAETQPAQAALQPQRAEFVPVAAQEAQPPAAPARSPAALLDAELPPPVAAEQPEVPQLRQAPRTALAAPRAVEPPSAPSPASNVLASQLVVNFAINSAQLGEDAKRQLASMRTQLLGAEHIIVKGRTDNQGGLEVNDRLALQRALAVHEFLTALAAGEPVGRIHVMGTGDCCFVADNDTEEGRAANRRAEISFVFPRTQSTVAMPAQHLREPS